jgi:hypothetical protein
MSKTTKRINDCNSMIEVFSDYYASLRKSGLSRKASLERIFEEYDGNESFNCILLGVI